MLRDSQGYAQLSGDRDRTSSIVISSVIVMYFHIWVINAHSYCDYRGMHITIASPFANLSS